MPYRTPELRLLDSRQRSAGRKRLDLEHDRSSRWKV